MSAAPGHKLTPSQKKEFHARMQFWRKELGLTGWRVELSRGKTSNISELLDWDDENMIAHYKLGNDWGETEPTTFNIIRKSAHEMLHLRMVRWAELCAEHGIEHPLAVGEEHVIIHTLELILAEWAILKGKTADATPKSEGDGPTGN
jgi:hypothetical protein